MRRRLWVNIFEHEHFIILVYFLCRDLPIQNSVEDGSFSHRVTMGNAIIAEDTLSEIEGWKTVLSDIAE